MWEGAKICINILGKQFCDRTCSYHGTLPIMISKEETEARQAVKRLLRSNKKSFMQGTLSAGEVKKRYDLTDEDLARIGSLEQWGTARYGRECIFWYLKYGLPLRGKSSQKTLF